MQDSCPSREPIVRRKRRVCLGLMLAAILGVRLVDARPDPPRVVRAPVALAPATAAATPFETLIRCDPLAALIEARARHLREVSDYECRMIKQELLPSGMSDEQEVKVKYRQEPFSVYMEWVRNPGLADRVLYVKGRWIDRRAHDPQDRELAVAQPGIIARLFVKSVMRPIHGQLARSMSRHSIDEFGFQNMLDRLIKHCELARSRGELSLVFRGESRFDGRPVWVIRRRLPYTGEGGLYPDRTADILIDRQYRVPIAIYSYSDEAERPGCLIGKYEFHDLRMGVGLTAKDFEPATYGM